jgi:RNA polymerase sigma-70 factor, ECF subfamily
MTYAQAMAARLESQPSDAELMRSLAVGEQDALGPLYARYASLVFHIGQQSLDRAAAEELVQEVFLTIWRSAAGFDPAQGEFKPWLLRLTHWKILNELRRRRRHPAEASETEEHEVADSEPGPEERAWQGEHAHLLKLALEALPAKQRQAVAMAFLDDMTHEQVARALDVPLGTAKTRIRSGLQILRLQLAPIAASLLAIALVAVAGWRVIQNQIAYDRDERAIALLATSELVPLRLTPAPNANVPSRAHANYRGRAGNPLAVFTAEALPPAPNGMTYQVWVRHGALWTSLGSFTVGADGNARLIAEDALLSTSPDAVEVTLEPSSGSAAPSSTVVLTWP